jgi:hypothetical protein
MAAKLLWAHLKMSVSVIYAAIAFIKKSNFEAG